MIDTTSAFLFCGEGERCRQVDQQANNDECDFYVAHICIPVVRLCLALRNDRSDFPANEKFLVGLKTTPLVS